MRLRSKRSKSAQTTLDLTLGLIVIGIILFAGVRMFFWSARTMVRRHVWYRDVARLELNNIPNALKKLTPPWTPDVTGLPDGAKGKLAKGNWTKVMEYVPQMELTDREEGLTKSQLPRLNFFPR